MEVVTENICKEVIFLLSSAFYSGETLGADIFVSWPCLCRVHCFVGSPCPEVNCVYALYFSFLTHQVFSFLNIAIRFTLDNPNMHHFVMLRKFIIARFW